MTAIRPANRGWRSGLARKRNHRAARPVRDAEIKNEPTDSCAATRKPNTPDKRMAHVENLANYSS